MDGFSGATGLFNLSIDCPFQSTPSPTPSPSISPSILLSRSSSPTPTPTHSADGVILCGQSVSGSTVGAGDDYLVGDPFLIELGLGAFTQGADVSYLFTAPLQGNYVFSTCNRTLYDSTIEVFTASPLVPVGFNDDCLGCAGFSSVLTVTLTPVSRALADVVICVFDNSHSWIWAGYLSCCC